MPIQAVLFDLDDTLLHHSPSAQRALSRVFAASLERGETTLERLRHLNDSLYEVLFPAILSGEHTRASARTERFRRMLENGGGSATLEQGAVASEAYLSFYDLERTPVSGAVPLLRALLKQVQVGILTNNPFKTAQDEALLEVSLEHWYVAQGAGMNKPNPLFFQHALERMRVEPENAVMVGDSWEKDVLPARRLGIRAVWFNPAQLEVPRSDVRVLGGFEPLEQALNVIVGL